MFTESQWAKQEFGGCSLGDKRRTERLVQAASKMLTNTSGGITRQNNSNSEVKAIYRLLDTDEVTHERIINTHIKRSIAQASNINSVVLFTHDDTYIDFSHRHSMTGLGRIGNDGGKGFCVHSCIATTPTGEILGLTHQAIWVRDQPAKTGKETRTERFHRRTEAAVWEECVVKIGRCPEGCTWVSVGDRGADIFSHFTKCIENKWDCLVRLKCERALVGGGRAVYNVRSLEPKSSRIIDLDGKAVEINVSWINVLLKRPKVRSNNEVLSVPCSIIRVWNKDEDIEWILLSTIKVTTIEEAFEKADWYKKRWLIEEFHKVLKTGCSIEKSQLRSAERFLPLFGLSSVVSIRLLQLRSDARTNPDAITTESEDTIKCLSVILKVKEETLRTNRGFARGVARLGGFLNRKSDGEPGWQTLWRGWEKLQSGMVFYSIATESKCG